MAGTLLGGRCSRRAAGSHHLTSSPAIRASLAVPARRRFVIGRRFRCRSSRSLAALCANGQLRPSQLSAGKRRASRLKSVPPQPLFTARRSSSPNRANNRLASYEGLRNTNHFPCGFHVVDLSSSLLCQRIHWVRTCPHNPWRRLVHFVADTDALPSATVRLLLAKAPF